MIQPKTSESIPLRTDADGVMRVGNTRVDLDSVIAAFREGATAEEIAQQYSSLQLADVYSVIGYCLHHPAEIDAYLLKRREQRDVVRQSNESRFDPEGVRDRLLKRRTATD